MIIWNNYEYGKKIYEERSIKTKKFQYKELKTLVSYMLLNDKRPKEIREVLEDCCQDDIKYLREKQKKFIFNKLIAQIKQELPKKDEIIKEKYIKSKKITIFVDEIDKIKAINSKKMEQVAFALLVYCKWLNGLKWFGMSKADIFREAKVTNLNSVNQQVILSKLLDIGYLKSEVVRVDRRHCHGVKDMKQQMWSLEYLEQNGEVAFIIDDYCNFVYRYLNYVYGGYFVCAGCGKIFKQNKNCTRKYCKDCVQYNSLKTKTIVCVDCGCEFKVNSLDTKTNRCSECYKEYRKDRVKENVHNYRERLKM